jgi:hypothetical protein
VDFDFFAVGRPVRIAWTARGSTNAFLVRDLYGDGKIVDGTEMFGNLTQQPPSQNENGFAALAQYDSNGDGWIDKSDPIWPSLLLWVDENHNGISDTGELHAPDSLGVSRISVRYKEVGRVDANGNRFRYRAAIDDVGARFAYDVFLMYLLPTAPSSSRIETLDHSDYGLAALRPGLVARRKWPSPTEGAMRTEGFLTDTETGLGEKRR